MQHIMIDEVFLTKSKNSNTPNAQAEYLIS